MNSNSPLRAVLDLADMRAVTRAYVDLDASYLPEGGDPVPAKISNISPMGAQVTFDGAHAAPDFLRLHVPNVGMFFEAEVRWQDGDTLGVQFTATEREEDGAG